MRVAFPRPWKPSQHNLYHRNARSPSCTWKIKFNSLDEFTLNSENKSTQRRLMTSSHEAVSHFLNSRSRSAEEIFFNFQNLRIMAFVSNAIKFLETIDTSKLVRIWIARQVLLHFWLFDLLASQRACKVHHSENKVFSTLKVSLQILQLIFKLGQFRIYR